VLPPLLKAIKKILKWQTESAFKIKKKNVPAQNFTLFLTSHIDHNLTDSDAIAQLKECLSDNIKNVKDFEKLLIERFDIEDVNKFAEESFPEFFCVSFPKYIIQIALQNFGWKVAYQKNYIYDRPDRYKPGENYQMMHSVAVYERLADKTGHLNPLPLTEYAESVKQLLNTGIQHVNDCIADKKVQRQLEQDLQKIIQLRDQEKD